MNSVWDSFFRGLDVVLRRLHSPVEELQTEQNSRELHVFTLDLTCPASLQSQPEQRLEAPTHIQLDLTGIDAVAATRLRSP